MFLNPWLLLGAAGISVPIIIHLLNRKRFQKVVWAAMRFLEAALAKNRQRMLIEELILLVLRCAILVLFAVALARPVLSGGAAILGRQPVTAVILLDQSGSMRQTDGTGTRFEKAQKVADEIVAGLPSGSSVALLLASDTVRDVIPQPSVDLALVRQNIAHTQPTDRGTDLSPGLHRAYDILAAVRAGNKQLFVITDGQAGGWRKGEGAAVSPDILQLLDAAGKQVETRVCLISNHDTRNLMVGGLTLTTELPTVDKPLRFQVDVQNLGNAEVRDVPVKLLTDARAAPVDEAVIPLIPGRSMRSVSLGCRIGSDGYHVVTASVPHDSLAADDQRSVVLRILGQVHVLLVNGAPGGQTQEEDEFFVRNALQPVPLEQRAGYFVQSDTIDASELDRTTLDKYDAIVMANVAELSQATIARLERAVNQGCGLLVFSGPRLNLDFYRDVLYRQHGLIPGWLGDAHGDAQGDHFATLQSGGFDHPITAPWNQKGQADPASARLFRMNDLFADVRPAALPVTDSPPGPTAIVAKYADGKTAICEHSFGQGRVLLVGTTANTQWTDLPARGALFVPLMNRILDRLLHRQEESLNIQVGQRLKIRRPTAEWGKDATIALPAGAADPALPPDASRVEMVDGWPTLLYDRTDLAGVYHLAIDGAAPGEPAAFAVQPGGVESDLQELSPRELEALSARASVLQQEGEVPRELHWENKALEIWRPLVTLVLLLLVTETVLAYRFSRVK